jgi:predicted GNAT superfamily acetyltransferase
MANEIEIRHCDSLGEFNECVQLERLTWGEDITVPAAIFVVAHHTGGQVLGAFQAGRLIGFTLALAAMRPGETFLHSHMTAVLPEYQNSGVGRRLKLFQREDALARGIKLVEWTFDPLELKNAHFNLARLGAIARRYIPNCYGVTESPLHAGLPTDRLVAEWWLDSERVKHVLEGKPLPLHGAARISLPTKLSELKATDRDAGFRLQAGAREKFLSFFQKGYAATYLEKTGETASYILEPMQSIAGLEQPEAQQPAERQQ